MKIIVMTGLGGSGTRLYGNIIKHLGIDLGKNINGSFDNLDLFYKTNYYQGIQNKLTFDEYEKFEKMFNAQIRNSYSSKDVIFLKEPNYHILLHMLHKYCEEKNHELSCLHIVRDGLYIMNSMNKGQRRWIPLFPELKKYNKNTKYLKFWYLANIRCINLLNELNIKHIILKYDYFTKQPKKQIKAILDLLDISVDMNIFDNMISKSEKIRHRSVKENIKNIPEELQNNIKEIESYL